MRSEQAYLNLLLDCYSQGRFSDNRTGIPTLKRFGGFWVCDDVVEDFPLLTTKRIHWRSVVAELLWFLSGSTNINDLDSQIWDEWADEKGELGPVYGYQWRKWFVKSEHFDGPGGVDGWTSVTAIDQIKEAERLLREDPDSRRILVSAWNVADLPQMALAPCHYAFQLQHCDGELNMMVNMRSIDLFLGLPFNIASYALLLTMFAHVHRMRPQKLCFSLGDYHIYSNHFNQVLTQLARPLHDAPRVYISGSHTSICDIRPEDIHLERYEPDAAIRAEVAV